MPDPVRVFVSYASPDRGFAERLVNDLRVAGAEVWWDVTGVNEGDFLKRINAALQNCDWCVLVLTPNAIASEWVEMEVNAAIHLRKQGFMKGVLPVLAAPTEPRTIPPLWANLHRYDAVSDNKGEFERLVRTLGLPSKLKPDLRPLHGSEIISQAQLFKRVQQHWILVADKCKDESGGAGLSAAVHLSRPIVIESGPPLTLIVETDEPIQQMLLNTYKEILTRVLSDTVQVSLKVRVVLKEDIAPSS